MDKSPDTERQKPPVLVIEDDENIAFYLKYMLQREGFQPILLPDGRAASDTIARYKAPSLVLMDIKLPFVDGLQLVTAIRAKPTWKDVPIIVLSSMSEEKVINRALTLGANDFVIKPFKAVELMARVRRYVR